MADAVTEARIMALEAERDALLAALNVALAHAQRRVKTTLAEREAELEGCRLVLDALATATPLDLRRTEDFLRSLPRQV